MQKNYGKLKKGFNKINFLIFYEIFTTYLPKG